MDALSSILFSTKGLTFLSLKVLYFQKPHISPQGSVPATSEQGQLLIQNPILHNVICFPCVLFCGLYSQPSLKKYVCYNFLTVGRYYCRLILSVSAQVPKTVLSRSGDHDQLIELDVKPGVQVDMVVECLSFRFSDHRV